MQTTTTQPRRLSFDYIPELPSATSRHQPPLNGFRRRSVMRLGESAEKSRRWFRSCSKAFREQQHEAWLASERSAIRALRWAFLGELERSEAEHKRRDAYLKIEKNRAQRLAQIEAVDRGLAKKFWAQQPPATVQALCTVAVVVAKRPRARRSHRIVNARAAVKTATGTGGDPEPSRPGRVAQGGV